MACCVTVPANSGGSCSVSLNLLTQTFCKCWLHLCYVLYRASSHHMCTKMEGKVRTFHLHRHHFSLDICIRFRSNTFLDKFWDILIHFNEIKTNTLIPKNPEKYDLLYRMPLNQYLYHQIISVCRGIVSLPLDRIKCCRKYIIPFTMKDSDFRTNAFFLMKTK